MSIVRAPRPDSGYYTLDKRISEDARLSWAARGLLVFLLGKPDHWSISIEHLRKQTDQARIKTGRDGIYALLDELQSVGYITRREQKRDGSGRMAEADYVVSEFPQDPTPSPDVPYTSEPHPAEPYTAGTTLANTESQQLLNSGKAIALPAARTELTVLDLVQDHSLRLPLNTGDDRILTTQELGELTQLYPAVDAKAELRKMRGWLLSNPTKRKTKSGVMRFVHTWLAKQQDRGGTPGHAQTNGMPSMPQSKTGQAIARLEAMRQGLFAEDAHEA